MYFRIILLIVFLFSGSFYAFPQNSYPHTPIHISEENGLSSNLVNCIHQSPDGLVWIGTKYGLTRYDGNRCTTFLPNDEITALCSDSDGDLYIGTENCLFRMHDDRTDTVFIAGTNSNFQRTYALAGTGDRVYLAYRARKGGRSIISSHMELSEEWVYMGYFYRDNGELRHSTFLGCAAYLPAEGRPFRFFRRSDGSVLFGGLSLNRDELIRHFDTQDTEKSSFIHITGYTETPEGDILYTELTEPHLFRYSPSSGKTTIEATFDFMPQTSLQGRDDIIYIGYGKGLVRYHYLSGKQVPLMTTESVHELKIDSDNNLWVGTDNGAYLFSYRKGAISFGQVTTPGAYPTLGFPSELWGSDTDGIIVNDTFTEQDGKVWASSFNSGLFCYDANTGSILPDTYFIKNNPGTSISYYNRRRETIFTCKHFRYDRFDLNEKKWHHYAPDIDDPRIDFLQAERIGLTTEEFVSKDIVYMEDDANWLVTPSRLVRHNLNDNSVTTILSYHTDTEGYSIAAVYPTHTDAEQMEGKGYFYIGVEGVLYRIDVASRHPSVIYRQGSQPETVIPPLNTYGRIFETRNGRLILGSGWYSEGMSILDPITKKVTPLDSVISKKKLLHNIIEDHSGNVLLYFTNPARLCAFDPDTWEEKYNIPCGSVKNLLLENETLWICGNLKPMIRFNTLDSTDMTVYPYDQNDPKALPTKTVMKIIPLKDSLYLIEGSALSILFDRRNQTFDSDFFTDPTSLNNMGTCICKDTSDRIWYGSRRGLSIIDRKKKSVRTYLGDIHFPHHISDAWINDITSDSHGDIWVGTRDMLYRYDALKDSLLPLESLSGKNIRNITEDLHGRLWIATANGLFCKLSHDSDSVRKFYSYLGFKGSSFGSRSVTDPDGTISFSGTGGWCTFHPDTLNSDTEAASIIVTDFKIDGKAGQDRLKDGYLDLSYSKNSISFYFSCRDFVFNKFLDYRYRIKGVDEEWIYTKAPYLFINYSNIPAGRHILEIEVTNRFGEWSEGDGLSIPVRIRYPVCWQWWSIIIYLILLFYIFKTVVHIREKNHLLEKKKLESMVNQRTSDLQREVELKNRFFSILSHDLKSPINGAAFTIDVFLRQYDHITEVQRKEMLDLLHMSLISSSDMLNSIMMWRQSQSTEIEPNYQKINLKESCRQVTDMYSAAFHKKDVTLEMDIPDNLFVITDKNILSTILRNLLGNALKYSYPEGRILLYSSTAEDKVLVSVQDFGIGMDEQIREHLFTMDDTHRRKGTANESGSGLGLLIVSEFLKKMGESIKIESEPKKGSTFTFTLRMSNL